MLPPSIASVLLYGENHVFYFFVQKVVYQTNTSDSFQFTLIFSSLALLGKTIQITQDSGQAGLLLGGRLQLCSPYAASPLLLLLLVVE